METPSLTVTTLLDVIDPEDGLISLREAMEVYASSLTISGAASINFASGLSGTFAAGTLSYGNTVITGNGVTDTIIGGKISVNGWHSLRLGQMAFNNNSDGAIYNEGSTTIVVASFSGNSGYEGGAIYNDGYNTISGGTFSCNSATYGGAIDNNGDATISDASFSGNSGYEGGAIYNNGYNTISGGTFTGNLANRGGAIYNEVNANIVNAIFSGNSANQGGAIYNISDFNDPYVKVGYMLLSDASFLTKTDTIYNGGTMSLRGTITLHATLTTTRAVDATGASIILVLNHRLTTDGVLINDCNLLSGTPYYSVSVSASQAAGSYSLLGGNTFSGIYLFVDEVYTGLNLTIGASQTYNDRDYQLVLSNNTLYLVISGEDVPSLTVNTTVNTVDQSDGLISLAEAMELYASGLAVDGSASIDFIPGLSGTFTPGALSYSNTVITGNGTADTVIGGKINVNAGHSLRLGKMTFSNNSNGAIYNEGDATIANVIFSGNKASDFGGAIYNGNTGSMILSNASFLTKTDTIYNGGTMSLRGDITLHAGLTTSEIVDAAGASIVLALNHRLTTDGVLINDYSLISGASDYSISVNTIQAGTYLLANAATTFAGSISLLMDGVDIGVNLTIGASQTYNGRDYQLVLSGDTLSLIISGGDTPSLTVDTTLNVINHLDGFISLSEAMEIYASMFAENGSASINFASGLSGTFTPGTLSYSNTVITGNGAANTVIGGQTFVDAGQTLTLAKMAFNGNLDGAIFNYHGTVSLTDATFSGNQTYNGSGGAIYNRGGVMTLDNVSFLTATDTIFNSAGTITLQGAITLNATLVDRDGLVILVMNDRTSADVALINDYSLVVTESNGVLPPGGKELDFSVSVSATQATGSYKLIGNVVNYDDSTLIGLIVGGTTTGVNLTVGSGVQSYGNADYRVVLSDNTLILQVWQNEVPSLTVTTVANTIDSYDGLISLREAIGIYASILAVNGSASIDFASGLSGTFNAGTLSYSNTVVTGNGATDTVISGGSFYISSGWTLGLAELTLGGILIDDTAGVIYNAGSATISGVAFSNNSANIVGGAIFNSSGGVLDVSDGVFAGNHARSGGAIHNYNSITLTNVDFSSNWASLGGAIYNFGSAMIGGGNFIHNSATYAAYGGGAIYNSGTAAISDATFINNSARSGGAILNYNSMTLTNVDFSGNWANSSGGAIYNSGSAMIDGGTFSHNSLTSASAFGGAIYNSGTATITGVKFIGNSAGSAAGAIYNAGTATISEALFSGNMASQGGAIYNGGTMTLGDASFLTKTDTIYNSATLSLRGIIELHATLTTTQIIDATGASLVLALDNRLATDGALLNDYSLISNAQAYAVSVSATQANGIYLLAGEAATFNNNVSLLVGGASVTSGLAIDTPFYYSGRSFTLSVDSGVLQLAIATAKSYVVPATTGVTYLGDDPNFASGGDVYGRLVAGNNYTHRIYGGRDSDDVATAVALNIESGAVVSNYLLLGGRNGAVGSTVVNALSAGTANNIVGGGMADVAGGTAYVELAEMNFSSGFMALKDNSFVFGGGIANIDGAEAINDYAIISIDGASLAQIHGGGYAINGGYAYVETVSIVGSAGTVAGNMYGGGLANGGNAGVTNVYIDILSGTYGFVLGGGYAVNGGTSIVDTVEITISGGRFNGTVYGGGQAFAATDSAMVTTASIVIDVSTNVVDFRYGSGITVGGNKFSTMLGDTGLTLTGEGSNLQTDGGVFDGWLNAGAASSGVDPNQTHMLRFADFVDDNFNARIQGFNLLSLVGDTAVTIARGIGWEDGIDYAFDLIGRDSGLVDTVMMEQQSGNLGLTSDSEISIYLSDLDMDSFVANSGSWALLDGINGVAYELSEILVTLSYDNKTATGYFNGAAMSIDEYTFSLSYTQSTGLFALNWTRDGDVPPGGDPDEWI